MDAWKKFVVIERPGFCLEIEIDCPFEIRSEEYIDGLPTGLPCDGEECDIWDIENIVWVSHDISSKKTRYCLSVDNEWQGQYFENLLKNGWAKCTVN